MSLSTHFGKPTLISEISTPVVVLQGVRDPVQQSGVAVARSLGRLGVAVYGVFATDGAAGRHSKYIRGEVLLDLQRDGARQSVNTLERLSREIGRQPLLIPTDDLAALFVAANDSILREKFGLPLQPSGLVHKLADKGKLWELCRQHKIPAPNSWLVGSAHELAEAAREASFPLVLKSLDPAVMRKNPRARSVSIIYSASQLEEQYEVMQVPGASNLMVQEYIPGGSTAVWMFNGYFNAASDCLFGMTGRKLRQAPLETGATTLGVCVTNADVQRLAQSFLRAVGYRGIVDMGFRLDPRDGMYKLLDVNPRIGATFRLFVSPAGMDVARALYLDSTGQHVGTQPRSDGRKWIVEMRDSRSAWQLHKARQLSISEWARSLRGVDEAAWFAADDLGPFFAMLKQYARAASLRLFR